MLRLVLVLSFSFNEHLKAVLDTYFKFYLYELMKCPWNWMFATLSGEFIHSSLKSLLSAALIGFVWVFFLSIFK